MLRRRIALLFDFDGTMAHTDPIHYEVWRNYLTGILGLSEDLSFDKFRQTISGQANEKILKDYIPSMPEADIAHHAAQKELFFREHAAKSGLHLMPGLQHLLQSAIDSSNTEHMLVTNAPVENVDFMLKLLDLETIFPQQRRILADDCERPKPHPDPYLAAVKRLGIETKDAVAFEDSLTGVTSAVSAGIKTVGIRSTLTKEELHSVGVSLTVDDYNDPEITSWTKDGFKALEKWLE
eukprot:m.24082 g.24082  ORF g.24082 m.24082 type:complete len:237 (-) comp13305_c0_seq1:22-732(-)